MENSLVVYPAIVRFDGINYNLDFIDLKECACTGNTIQEVCSIAQRNLISVLRANSKLPKPTLDFSNIQISHGQLIVLISADTSIFRDTRAVKKTLTIPSWLNDLAIERKINFSQVLQNALKAELGLSD